MFRISNDYLLAILSLVTSLGTNNVSSAVLVEAWRASGHECDDVFLLHYDTLFEYRFLKPAVVEDSLLGIDQLLACKAESDVMVTITHEGIEFLHCFGGK